jgi:hypothetical protein
MEKHGSLGVSWQAMICRLSVGRVSVGPAALLAGIVAAALALRLAWIGFVDDGLHHITLPPLDDRGAAYTELLTKKLTDDAAGGVYGAIPIDVEVHSLPEG